MRVLGVATLCAFAVCGVTSAEPTIDLNSFLNDPSKIVSVLDEKMNVEVPPEVGKYIKQGRMFFTMFKGKLKTTECKTNYENMYKLLEKTVEDKLNDKVALTARMLINPFCEIGDTCISEAIDVGLAAAKSNKLIKAGLDNMLKTNNLDLDTVVSSAPLLYMGLCAAFENIKSNENAGVIEDKTEL